MLSGGDSGFSFKMGLRLVIDKRDIIILRLSSFLIKSDTLSTVHDLK